MASRNGQNANKNNKNKQVDIISATVREVEYEHEHFGIVNAIVAPNDSISGAKWSSILAPPTRPEEHARRGARAATGNPRGSEDESDEASGNPRGESSKPPRDPVRRLARI